MAPPGGGGAPSHVPSASGDGAAAGAGGAGAGCAGAGAGAGHAAAAGMSRLSVPGLRAGLRAAGRTRDPRRSLRATSHPGRAARRTGRQAQGGWGRGGGDGDGTTGGRRGDGEKPLVRLQTSQEWGKKKPNTFQSHVASDPK